LKAALRTEQDLVGIRTEQQVTETTRRQDPQALVREQVEHLPLTYHTILILRHLHDQTYEEIAAILSMPVGTVKIRLFRARALLKERFTAPLVTRETVSGTPLTENEEVMHPSGQFPFHGRGQDSAPDNQETDDFLQQQQVWLEQQQSWLEQRRGWLTQQGDKLMQQEAWLIQQEAWLDQQHSALVQQHQWVQQRRSWLDRKPRQLTQQDSALIQEDESGERLSG
jgi:Sigma-70, region 4